MTFAKTLASKRKYTQQNSTVHTSKTVQPMITATTAVPGDEWNKQQSLRQELYRPPLWLPFAVQAGWLRCIWSLPYYRLTELPDGYAEEIVVKNDSCCISFYQNEAGDRIIFAQSVTEDFAIDVDNENGKHSQIDLSGTDVSIYESAGVMVAVWLHDQYAFSLTVYGDCGIDLMIKLIDSVQRQWNNSTNETREVAG